MTKKNSPLKVLVHGGGGGADDAKRVYDGGGGGGGDHGRGGACQVLGEGGECVQRASRGRGSPGGRGRLLLQLAHPEGAPAPGELQLHVANLLEARTHQSA